MSSLYALRGVKFLTTLIVEKRWKKLRRNGENGRKPSIWFTEIRKLILRTSKF